MDEHTANRLTQHIQVQKEDGSSYFFKFPDDNSTGQLKNIGDGNLEFEGDNEYYIIKDIRSVGTNGGNFSNNAWTQRVLNTLSKYPSTSTNISLSNNEFTLQQGTYNIKISTPAYRVGEHQCRLYNITESNVETEGTSEYADKNNNASSSTSVLETFVIVSSSTTFKVEHQCSTTKNSYGFGLATGFGSEVYTTIIIRKIS